MGKSAFLPPFCEGFSFTLGVRPFTLELRFLPKMCVIDSYARMAVLKTN